MVVALCESADRTVEVLLSAGILNWFDRVDFVNFHLMETGPAPIPPVSFLCAGQGATRDKA